jgi:alginate O-acetyltransferase complex protein AlgI
MIFCTYWFLAAAALFLPIYWLTKSAKIRLALLLLFCFVFHAHFAGPAGVAPIIVLGLITFFIGRSKNVVACSFGIALCVVALCFYKYTHFFFGELLSHIHPALGAQLDDNATKLLPAVPPLAISFFTFEFVHYLFEVRRGGEPIRSLRDFAQFTFYFPSLVAGPIKRYSQFLPAMHEGLKKVKLNDITSGLIQIAIGFLKKAVVADNLTLYINNWWPHFDTIGLGQRWLLLLFIAFRIYMDFSGYSDMAIGFSRMMGISLPRNFNWPYMARNIQDFWQRWHISLSSWIRDYVYIPLGGNRCGAVRKVLNGLIAFALCGLWHGAALNFVLWGLYHGVGLAICSSYRKMLGPLGSILGKAFDRVPVVSWAVTMLFVCIGWLLFFYSPQDAWKMTRLLFKVA